MPLGDNQKAEMRATTLEAAVALVDDLEHIRSVLAKQDPTPGDIRRLSGLLRRILIDRILTVVATPRVGRIMLLVPDNKPIIASNRSLPVPFYASAGASIFGISISCALQDFGGKPRDLGTFHPDSTASVRLDGFVNQQVICLGGQWITRGDVIKYIANIAHGVHSSASKNEKEVLIERARHAASMSIIDDMPTISFNPDVFSLSQLPPILDRKAVDFVLIELFAAATFLTKSPEVVELESIIAAEIGA